MHGQYDREFGGFFAHQVSLTWLLAVLNGIANIPGLTTGTQLRELLSFAAELDPQTRGMVITSSDWLREAHNSLSPPSAISLDGLGLPKTSEDAYHFVVYTPSMGSLYELDGLKEFPVNHGSYEETGEGWLKKARDTIEARIATYPPGSLEFSLLALRDDPLPSLEAQLARLQAANMHAEAAETVVKISAETSKRERWAFENSLRRHNHVGLVHALVVALAKSGKLQDAKNVAKEKMKQKIAARKAKGGEDAEMSDD
ncbi:Ubiquitin carboxyl-terminal hydrolase [Mycena kentingensis (nom. inval.)]|nr:Ubiquitin carboxyl-terminal hydrolase [Mycena kentingensis (nom. inval.)]